MSGAGLCTWNYERRYPRPCPSVKIIIEFLVLVIIITYGARLRAGDAAKQFQEQFQGAHHHKSTNKILKDAHPMELGVSARDAAYADANAKQILSQRKRLEPPC